MPKGPGFESRSGQTCRAAFSGSVNIMAYYSSGLYKCYKLRQGPIFGLSYNYKHSTGWFHPKNRLRGCIYSKNYQVTRNRHILVFWTQFGVISVTYKVTRYRLPGTSGIMILAPQHPCPFNGDSSTTFMDIERGYQGITTSIFRFSQWWGFLVAPLNIHKYGWRITVEGAWVLWD